jgi:hypothetical protein
VWLRHSASNKVQCAEVLRRAIRVPDPFFAVRGSWIVRRLAPDCARIELDALPKQRDEVKLLRAMGWETANIHLGTARARIASDLGKRPSRWLPRAAADMAAAATRDWREWSRR